MSLAGTDDGDRHDESIVAEATAEAAPTVTIENTAAETVVSVGGSGEIRFEE